MFFTSTGIWWMVLDSGVGDLEQQRSGLGDVTERLMVVVVR